MAYICYIWIFFFKHHALNPSLSIVLAVDRVDVLLNPLFLPSQWPTFLCTIADPQRVVAAPWNPSRGNSGGGEGVGAAIVTARSRPSIIIS